MPNAGSNKPLLESGSIRFLTSHRQYLRFPILWKDLFDFSCLFLSPLTLQFFFDKNRCQTMLNYKFQFVKRPYWASTREVISFFHASVASCLSSQLPSQPRFYRIVLYFTMRDRKKYFTFSLKAKNKKRKKLGFQNFVRR